MAAETKTNDEDVSNIANITDIADIADPINLRFVEKEKCYFWRTARAVHSRAVSLREEGRSESACPTVLAVAHSKEFMMVPSPIGLTPKSGVL